MDKTLDDWLSELKPADLRTTKGKAAKHALTMAKYAMDDERREFAKTLRDMERATEIKRLEFERDRVKMEKTQAILDAHIQDLDLVQQMDSNWQKVLAPLVPKKVGPALYTEGFEKFQPSKSRGFVLSEIEEACIRFRVAGGKDLSPIEFGTGTRINKDDRPHSIKTAAISCKVSEELPEAVEDRDRRLREEALEKSEKRINRWITTVAAVVIGPPATIATFAGLKYVYLLTLGWL